MSIGTKVREAADALGEMAERAQKALLRQRIMAAFAVPEVGARQATAAGLRQNLARFEGKLGPERWLDLNAAIDEAVATGSAERLVTALEAAEDATRAT